ncbi:hypothetical protein SLEP1_g19001 [Rubroshorea leprosula]|nr:hypothetical protein SLEP1_g19001 [Rubroshorea leprosula]
MADALVSDILGQLATIISKEAEREVKLVTDVEKEINKLSSNLESIQTLLQDVEERQIKDRSIRNWLTKLKDVCYDMEDVLDEWNTALLKFEIDEADLENFDLCKVCCPFIPCFSFGRQVVHRRDIALKIKEINERLDVIAKEKDSCDIMTMNSVRKFPPEQLSDSVCWKIISQEAFVGRDEEQCKSLEDIGKRITERCSGLPLVAKTLRGMLRFKKTSDDWKNILNSEIWQLDLVENEVYVPLLLSFFDLPSAWMAQGCLSSDENAEVEITGDEYFDCLVERSFFQDVLRLNGITLGGKIHDITVDFARFFMGNEFVSKDLHSVVKLSLEKTRHLLVRQMSGTSFPMLLGAENLRSLTIFDIHEKENQSTEPDHLRHS